MSGKHFKVKEVVFIWVKYKKQLLEHSSCKLKRHQSLVDSNLMSIRDTKDSASVLNMGGKLAVCFGVSHLM